MPTQKIIPRGIYAPDKDDTKLIETRAPVKVWTNDIEEEATAQLMKLATLPFIHKHIAVMPDVHHGIGSTVGTVIPTKKAIIPAAVGVDIGCGMMAYKLTLQSHDLPLGLSRIRAAIEAAVPHGRTDNGGANDRGAWGNVPPDVDAAYGSMFVDNIGPSLMENHPKLDKAFQRGEKQLGTLGTGNHFIEVCLDKEENVWIMLHSGSRGVGNAIGRYFIERAKEEMVRWHIDLADKDLAYLPEGHPLFRDYWNAVSWAQNYALVNRQIMMRRTFEALQKEVGRTFEVADLAVNCHHNYVSIENHFGENVYVTRKGAVRARAGDLGIIPGSMGARSFIVRGLGNPDSFHSCSHGAGRRMSRTRAKQLFTEADLREQTLSVECRKDADVIDEIPSAYKPIDEVMANQSDLVEVVAELRQIVCVKG